MDAGSGTRSITATSALLLSPVEAMLFLYSGCSGLTVCLLLQNSQLTNTRAFHYLSKGGESHSLDHTRVSVCFGVIITHQQQVES